jgi:SAM-dependent methyltransferase
MSELQEHVARNRAHWDALAQQYVEAGERAWAKAEPAWGIWQVPESELHLLAEPLAGKDAIELGCGTAHVSAWFARRGARMVGIDNSEAQLATARRLQRQYGLEFPLLHGDAEAVPSPDASFDFAISEYGACLWADPQRWVPEAARLLRPGGRLVFLTNSFLLTLCVPPQEGAAATERLLRPAFGMHRVEWPDGRRQISPLPWRLDPAAAGFGLGGRGLDRATARAGGHLALCLRHARVGPPVAIRRGVEGA